MLLNCAVTVPLLAAGSIREYAADHTLMRQGDPTTFVIVLLDGVVKATGVSSSGKESLIGVIVGGDLVGEFAALDNRPRSATVTTCGLVSGCVIRQKAWTQPVLSPGIVARRLVASTSCGRT